MISSFRSFLHPTVTSLQSRQSDDDGHQHLGSRGGGESPQGVAGNRSNTRGSGSRATDRAAWYPEALPCVLNKKYNGPVLGTAVIDEATMPLAEATAIFEMVTPASSPLVKTQVKERFEAAVEKEMEYHRVERAKGPHSSSHSWIGSCSSSKGVNTSSYFPTPDLPLTRFHPGTAPRRREVLNKGSYFIFSDSYLTAHPLSCITGVTKELHMAAPHSQITPHEKSSGPDAGKRRLQEVKDYIKEAEHEYRPLFRRRRSDMLYGRAQYL